MANLSKLSVSRIFLKYHIFVCLHLHRLFLNKFFINTLQSFIKIRLQISRIEQSLIKVIMYYNKLLYLYRTIVLNPLNYFINHRLFMLSKLINHNNNQIRTFNQEINPKEISCITIIIFPQNRFVLLFQ